MIYSSYFQNFNLRSIHGFELYSLEENKILNLSYGNYNNVFKFYHIISRKVDVHNSTYLKDDIGYFRIKASPDEEVYTTIDEVVTIAKPNQIIWIKFFVNEWYCIELDLPNNEVAELEILYLSEKNLNKNNVSYNCI